MTALVAERRGYVKRFLMVLVFVAVVGLSFAQVTVDAGAAQDSVEAAVNSNQAVIWGIFAIPLAIGLIMGLVSRAKR